MSARTLGYTIAGLAFALVFTAVPAQAQYGATSSTSSRPAYAHYPPVYDPLVRNVPLGDRRPAIFLTSINFPGVYGAYARGVESSSYDVSPQVAWQATGPRPVLYRTPAETAPVGYLPATIRVLVPGHAELFFQDQKVSGDGFVRELDVPPMSPNNTSAFEVRARWKEDGRTVARRELVRIRGGETAVVDFGSSQSASPSEEGTSTLRAAPLPTPGRRP
jgi:uncharacterized protein (TIGR03000 family)